MVVNYPGGKLRVRRQNYFLYVVRQAKNPKFSPKFGILEILDRKNLISSFFEHLPSCHGKSKIKG